MDKLIRIYKYNQLIEDIYNYSDKNKKNRLAGWQDGFYIITGKLILLSEPLLLQEQQLLQPSELLQPPVSQQFQQLSWHRKNDDDV